MKEKYGVETIILFHVGDSFEAYFDDAGTITRVMEVPRFRVTTAGIPTVRISDAALEEHRDRLLDIRCKIYVSEVQRVSGCHIPRINRTSTEADR